MKTILKSGARLLVP